MNGMPVISNLQTLRGIAALMVILHHVREYFSADYPWISEIHLGAAGVDVFFVLSGVVISLSDRGDSAVPSQFLVRRIIRVVPMYWLALFVVGALLLLGMSPLGIAAQDATLGNMLRSMGFVPFERAHGVIMPLLGVGWTLNYEMFFYLVYAACIFLVPALRAVAVATVMLGLVMLGLVLAPQTPAGMVYTNPILLEFVAGVLLAQLWRRLADQPVPAWLGFGLVGAGLVWFISAARPEAFDILIQTRVLLFGIPAVLVVSGAMMLEAAGWRSTNRFWLLLGAASYAAYLFHPIVLQVVEKAAHFAGLPVVVLAGLSFVLSHVVGIAVHLWVEKPMTQSLGRLIRRDTVVSKGVDV